MRPPPPDGPETMELAPGPPRRWPGNPGTHAGVEFYTLELKWTIPESTDFELSWTADPPLRTRVTRSPC